MSRALTTRQFVENSRQFFKRHSRPTPDGTLLENLIKSNHLTNTDLEKHISSTNIIVHTKVRKIAQDFLLWKSQHGTHIEKQVYQDLNHNVDKFFARLVSQRPLTFYNASDATLLRNHKFIMNGTSKWDQVGTDNEDEVLKMKDYLTYEEIMISSLIGMSGYTVFINDGNRCVFDI